MKKQIAALSVLLLSAFILIAQDKYTMFETVYLTPKDGKGKEMVKAIHAHNKQFHAEGAHQAYLQAVITGEHMGDFVWVMGPCTFTDLDSRPEGDAHDNDWNDVVGAYIEDASMLEYWYYLDSLSFSPSDTSLDLPMLHIRIFNVKPGKWDDFKGVLKQVRQVYVKKDMDEPWSVYYNVFDSGDGRDVAALYRFKSWASFDEDSNWSKDFDSVHGEGSWDKAMEVIRASTSDVIEEIRVDVDPE